MNYSYEEKIPKIHTSVFVAPTATIIGDVEIDADSSVWFNSVIRADVNWIRIGRCTNIQDGSILHVTYQRHSLELGDYVTAGHGCIVHGCRIENYCLIGMGARVLDGAHVGEYSLLAAGSLVREGQRIPSYSLAAGVPAIVKRSLSDEELEWIKASAERYVGYKNKYMSGAVVPLTDTKIE